MLWADIVTDDMQREQAQAEYVECPVCYGRGELPLGDGADETDCFLCCGHGRVPATQAAAFEAALAKGVGL